ncbi:MAG: hypothetical protein R6X29_04255 [Acidimicrobiia bacterium]
MNIQALAFRRVAGLVLLLVLIGAATIGMGMPPASAEDPHILVVDGVEYDHAFETRGTIHWYTPGVDEVDEARYGDVVWDGQGSENLPCEGELHWVYSKVAKILVISECVPAAPTTTPPAPPVTPPTTPPVTAPPVTPPTTPPVTTPPVTPPTPPVTTPPVTPPTTPPVTIPPVTPPTTPPTSAPGAELGRILVVKEVQGIGPAQSFPFVASWSATGFSLADGESNVSGDLPPGIYAVSENVPPGTANARWELIDAECDNGDEPSAITIGAGDTVTCTFVNAFVEVGGIQVTTTTAPATTTTAAVVPTVVTLPFTGSPIRGAEPALALALLGVGAVWIVLTRSRRATGTD